MEGGDSPKGVTLKDMPTSRHCFPGDLPPKSRRLDENLGDFNNVVSAYDTSFFGHFKHRISRDISHRSVSRTGHFKSFFFSYSSHR